MRIATFDRDRVGVLLDGDLVDVTSVVPAGNGSTMLRLIREHEQLRNAITQAVGGATRRALVDVTLKSPVPDPTKIVAAPVNYVDHMSEMSETIDISSLGVFLKAPSSLLDPGGVIELPYDDRRFDHEAELAVVIGTRARRVHRDQALEHVFGYTCLLDITMRGGEDRSVRKSFDTFTPMGPYLVTADEFGDPTDARVEGRVNGVVRQSASTADLIWGVAQLVEYMSSVLTLEPGDVIATGTPAGVGPIVDGDQVEVEISRIGVLRASVSAAHATTCPTSGSGRGPRPPAPPRPVAVEA